MDDRHFDDLLTRALNPALIPGIYNYCDRCCWRCGFTERCLSYLERRCGEADPAAAVDAGAAIALSLRGTFEMLQTVARRCGLDTAVTADDLERARREHEERSARLAEDPLLSSAQNYARMAGAVTTAVRPAVEARGDAVVMAAVDRISETCFTIVSKIYAALDSGDEPDVADVQSYANGSAKVARILVEDSRRAWRVLMEVGRATADGVPARLVAALDDLERTLTARFPHAMQFVRPGFDEVQAERAVPI